MEVIPEVTRPLTAAMGTKWNGNGDLESSLIPSVVGMLFPPDLCGALTDGAHNGGGLNGQDAYTGRIFPVVFDPAQVTSVTNRSNPQPGDPCHTLHQGEAPMLVRMREGKEGGGKGPLVSNDQSLTLATANDQVLAYAIQERAVSENVNAGPQGKGWQEDVAFTMEARHHAQSISSGMQVRRLTPTECCRLQGFQDDYLDIAYRGKPAADGPKYKALGNSWAVTVVNYIGQRIQSVSK
jgi:site-specific DNA-cytosine methylase